MDRARSGPLARSFDRAARRGEFAGTLPPRWDISATNDHAASAIAKLLNGEAVTAQPARSSGATTVPGSNRTTPILALPTGQPLYTPANHPCPHDSTFEFLGNAIAASLAGAKFRSFRSPGSIRRGLSNFSDDALSYVSLRPAPSTSIWNCGACWLAGRRACSSHTGVARVSRLIGNSDTTANRFWWQVARQCRIPFAM